MKENTLPTQMEVILFVKYRIKFAVGDQDVGSGRLHVSQVLSPEFDHKTIAFWKKWYLGKDKLFNAENRISLNFI